MAARQLGTVVVRTLKASELLWLCFKPYILDYVGINIDYAALALLCIFFFSFGFGSACCRYRERAGQTPVSVSVWGTES